MADGVMTVPDAAQNPRLLPVQWVTAIGVAVVMTAVVVVAMAGADAIMAKATMLSRSLRLSQMLSQCRVPVSTGAVIVLVVVMAKVAVAISNHPMMHRKTLRHSSSNNSHSQQHASSLSHVNV